MSRENVLNCVHKVAKSEGFLDYKIETSDGTNHGDNFVGVLIAVTITGTKRENDTSKQDELHLMCKVPPTNDIQRDMCKTNLLFQREIWVYSKLLPAFTKFQQEKGLNEADSFASFPKIYSYEDDIENSDFILIMQNLKPDGFSMWPKNKIMSFDHGSMILHELGKLHGVSFAMKDQRPHEFEEFKHVEELTLGFFLESPMAPLFKDWIKQAVNVIKDPAHKIIMKNFSDNVDERMRRCLCGEEFKEFGIIGHGDCWNNNFMYQYHENDKTKVKAISIVDWQATHYCSPVLDILYAIFSATDKRFRDQYYEILIKNYYSSLSETIRKLGSDPDKLYTFDNLQSQLRKFGDFALYFGTILSMFRISKPAGCDNFDEYSERATNGEDISLIHFDDESQAEFSRLTNDLMTDLIEYGYIN